MTAEPFSRPEIFYYQQDGTRITSRYFTTPRARFLVRDLTRFARSERDAESGFKVGLVTAVLELLIVLPALSILNPSVGLALVVPALVIPFIVASGYARGRRAKFELMANYRGRQQVTLFVTSDQTEFGQVALALLRAAEAADD